MGSIGADFSRTVVNAAASSFSVARVTCVVSIAMCVCTVLPVVVVTDIVVVVVVATVVAAPVIAASVVAATASGVAAAVIAAW